jgi:hypothetical protein
MLKRFWEAWKRLAHRIGDFQARALLTILYAVLVLPFGVAVRLFADPLRMKRRPADWLDRSDSPADLIFARKQW